MRVLMYIIAIGVVIYAWLGNSLGVPWSIAPNDTIPRPQNEWIDATRALSGYRIDAQDAAKLSAFYEALSVVLKNDDGRLVSNVSDFRQAYTAIGNGCFGTDLVGKYQGLGAAIDSVLNKAVSSKTNELDEANRQRLSEVCNAIAWRFSYRKVILNGF